MFFQSPPSGGGGSSSGGVTDADLKRMEDRIVNAIQTGFKNAKLDRPSTTTTTAGKDDGYFGRRSSGGDTSTKTEIEQDILSPGRMLTNMQSKILGPLYAAGKDLSLEMSKALTSLQSDATNVFVQFGKGREASSAISQALGEAKYSIMEMGGNAQAAFATLTDLYDTTNKTSLSSAQYVDDLYATAEVTGVRVGELAGKFEAVGSSISSVSKTMMDVVDYAASVGLNVQAVSKQVIQNFEKLNTYNFEGGVKGLTRMAAQATMLKMDMSKTLALADDLLSPEKAIDMAAGLQRLGVSTSALIDPLRLMDMAQNDPEQLQNEIVNLTKQYTYFNEETKKTEILPGAQRYLRELAPILGLSTQELANMAVQSGTIERKLSEIRMPNVIQTEEDKMLFANLAELNKEGKYEIKYFDENAQEQKVLLENMTETQRDAIKASQKIMDDPKEIAKRQLTAAEQTNMLLESLGARLPRELAEKKTTYELGELTTTASRMAARGMYDAGRETLGISPKDLEKYDEEIMKLMGAAKTKLEKGDAEILDILNALEGGLQSTFDSVSKNAAELIKGIMDEEGNIDLDKLGDKIGNVFLEAGTTVAGNVSDGFKNAIDIELKGASSIFAESLLKGTKNLLNKLPEEPTIEGKIPTTETDDETMIPDTESVSNETPIINTNTNNLKGEDVIINNEINDFRLSDKDTALVGRDGMMAGTDLMGLKDRFGDMSTELSKSLLSGVEEIKSGFKSILGTSPTLFSRQTETGIEPNLLSDNLNVTLNPELAPEFAKIRKEVREMGENIPLDFKFTLPKFEFNFGTEENMNSYLEFKKRLEDQLIKPNIQTEENKIKFTADKVEGMEKIDSKLDEVKNTKIEIPTKIDDKDLQEPLIKKVETTFDDTKIKDMSESLFSEKRLNIGFEFENRDEFEKLSKEFDEITKEKNIHLKQDEFEPNIPKEETIKIKTEQEEFKSNVPQEQISNLKFEFDKEKTNSLYDQINEKFGEPFHLKFDQEKFDLNVPKEQTIKINTEQEKFESKIPEEQKLKLDYEFSNKSDFEKVLDNLYKTKDPYKIKFESEKFEPNIPKEETIKIKTEQEDFKSNIPKEETLKLDYDFSNQTGFEKILDELYKTKDPFEIKFVSEKFESTIPKEETIEVKSEIVNQKETEDILTKMTSDKEFKLFTDESSLVDINKNVSSIFDKDFFVKPKMENIPLSDTKILEDKKLNLSFNFENQNETETLINKMSSDKEFKLFTDTNSLTKESEKVSSIFDNEIKLQPKIDEGLLKDVSLPKMEQEVSLKQPEESEMDSLKQKFENSAEQLKSSFRIPTSLVDNLSLTSGLNRNEYSNTNLQSGGNLLQNENTNNFNSQSTTDIMMRMLTERFATPNNTTNPTVQPVSTPREIISPTTNLGSTTNNTKMEFGELKIVHEIKVSSGNVDPSVVGQAFTQLTRDPSFVKTLETKIKDLQGGMGQQSQMNPMTA